jgi:uncharacterized protein
MDQALFRFYGELNDFLPVHKRQTEFIHYLKERGSIKDTIEALGVPHPEVDLIVVNGESVDFSYLVQDGDRIRVYPVNEIEHSQPSLVRWEPLEKICFVLDVHLGRLATYLRLLGFDSAYWNDADDEALARISSTEHRVLLTQDRGLLKRSVVTHGYFVRASDPKQQIIEVLKRFNLGSEMMPFTRCLRCNGVLESVTKDTVYDRLSSLTQQHYHEFSRCQTCNHIYWKGGHYERMQGFVDRVRNITKPEI